MLWRELLLTQSVAPSYIPESKLYAWGASTAGQLGFFPPNAHSIAQLSAGGNHMLAITSTGKLLAWGQNNVGQLAVNDVTTRSVPTQVGNDSWTSVSAGQSHSAAVRSDGALFVWGVNTGFILGTGDSANRSSPVQIASSLSWNSIRAGQNHNLAIASNNTLYAWGVNNAGQLGTADTLDRSSPVQVSTSSWSQVSAGYSYSTAIDSTGRLYTWGLNSGYQLGDNTSVNKSSIVQVNAGPIGTTTSWSRVSAGVTHALGISSTGALYTWGLSAAITLLNEPRSWVSLSLGSGHGAAIRSDGFLYIWGTNAAGQLGTGDTLNRSSPVLVGTSSWSQVDTGGSTTVAVKSDGTLWSWGLGTTGELGNGTAANRSSPVQIGSDVDWSVVNVGPSHTLAVKTNKTAYGWGLNSSGQLGDNTSTNKSSPVQVNTGTVTSWNLISAGSDHTLAIDSTNILYGWGKNDVNQTGTHPASWAQIATIDAQTIGQYAASSGIRGDGSLWYWGANGFVGGSSPLNNSIQYSSPVQVGNSSWIAVGIGVSFGVAVRADHTLWAWGTAATNGQGDGIVRSSPTQIGTDSDWSTNISVGLSGTVHAVKLDGTLYGWNASTTYFLGDGITYARSTPTLISGASWAVVSTTHGIRTDGTLWAWGSTNSALVNGINDGVVRSSMTQVGTSSWLFVSSANSAFTAGMTVHGIDAARRLFAWGSNSSGQIGDSTTINRSSPVLIGTSSWTAISSMAGHTHGIDILGKLYGWGSAQFAGNGTNTTIDRSAPVQINTVQSFVFVGNKGSGAGGAISTTGDLYMWGNSGSTGAMGFNDNVSRSSPTLLGTAGPALATGVSAPTQIRYPNITNGYVSWTSVSAGQSHSAVINTLGHLYIWGFNNAGQVGDNTTFNKTLFSVKIADSWNSVAAGISHTVAAKSTGSLWAWGLGTSGQLGNSAIITRSSPVQVGTSSFTNVTAGLTISGAIGIDNTIYTWGLGTSGQLGNTNTVSQSSPAQVGATGLNSFTFIPTKIGNSSYVSVAAGTSYSLAVDSNNNLYAWGLGTTGQLGLGQFINQNINRSSPTQVLSGSMFNVIDNSLTAATVANFTAGYSTSIVPFAGTVSGVFNGDQALIIPYSASHILGAASLGGGQFNFFTIEAWIYNSSSTNAFGIISAWQGGGQFSFAVNTSNRLVFVYNNAAGDVGVTITATTTTVPKNTWAHVAVQRYFDIYLYVNGVQDTTSDFTGNTISYTGGVGKDIRIGVAADNATPAVGYISNLRFTKGTGGTLAAFVYTGNFTPPSLAPLATSGAGSAAAYSSTTNVNTTFAATNTQVLLYTTSAASISTTGLSALVSFAQVSAQSSTSLAIATDSVLYTWGLGTTGQTGKNDLISRSAPVSLYMNTEPSYSSPTQIGNSSWTTVNAGVSHTMALQYGNTLWDWGFNNSGQLGLSTDTLNRSSPVQVGTSSWTTVASGISYSLAVRSDSTLWAYGANGLLNTLGDVPSSVKWNSVVYNGVAFAAIRNDGTLWSWGSNTNGELGLNDTINRSSPAQVGSSSSWASLGSAGNCFFAINTLGELYSWGFGTYGRLGLGDQEPRSNPTQITSVATSWTFVTRGGSAHVGAITTGNILYMWGLNGSGQCGNNNVITANDFLSAPTQLASPWDTTQVSYVSLNTNYSSLITTDGKLHTWGGTNFPSGQLGNPTMVSGNGFSVPTQIGAGSSWISVALHGAAGTAITNTYDVYYWGLSSSNPLGNTFNRSSPVLISSGAAGASWVQVYGSGIGGESSAGAFVIRSDGALWGLGSSSGTGGTNWNSAIRNGDTLFSTLTVSGGNNNRPLNWNHVTRERITLYTDTNGTNARHAAAFIREDGSLLIWGTVANSTGIYGENSTTYSIRSGPTLLASSNFFPYLSSPVQIGSGSWTSVISTKLGTSGGFISGIQSDGSLWSWGNNEAFLMGNNTTQDRLVPNKIGASSWSQISATNSHMLAIRSDGALFAWGINTNGRLGTFDLVTRSSPAQVGTSSWSQVSAGVDHSLGIDSAGRLFAWGNNAFGATGVITPLVSWTQISEGLSFTLAIRSDGGLFAWGQGAVGRLGLGDTFNRSSPTQIGTSSWTQAYASAGSSYAAAIRSDGTMWSWGTNANFELGNGDSINRSSPVQVLGTTSWSQLALGTTHGLAVTTTGQLYGWGQSTGLYSSTAPFSWTQVSEGKSHTVALRQDGLLFTWGNNNAGQLGTSDTINRSSPTQIGTSSWTSVAAGASHTLAVRSDGMVFAWGLNTSNQLGDTTFLNRSSPVQIATTSFASVTAGDFHSLALDTNNLLYGWGLGATGQLGVTTTPISWTAIAAGYSHSLGISTSNLYAWGLNASGQLGDTSTLNRSSPVLVGTGDSWISVNGGDSHSIAIGSTNATYVWGLNNAGQLGDGSTFNKSTPVQIVHGGFSLRDASSFNYTIDKHLSSYSTTVVPFTGSVSGVFNAPNQYSYYFGSNTVWLTALGDLTWEAWIYPTSFNGPTNSCAIISCGIVGGNGDDLMIRANPSANSTTTLGMYAINTINGAMVNDNSATAVVRINVWQHVALVRRSGVFYAYLNGVQVITNAAFPSTSLRLTSTAITVGRGFANSINDYFIGYISNVRIVNGLAVYTGTPFAVPTAIATDTQSAGTNIAEITSGTTDLLLYTTPAASINTDPAGNEYSDISAGLSFTGAIDTIGRLYTWGLGTSGQLGIGSVISRSYPAQVTSGTSSYVQISVGASTAATIDTLGRLWVWGAAATGQLGQGNVLLVNQSLPVQVAPGTSWSQVSNGPSHTLAVRSDGSLWTWGLGTSGQLGNNAAVTRSSPVQVGVDTDWLKVTAGFNHSMAIKSNATLWGWGANDLGQVGYLTTLYSWLMVSSSGLGSHSVAIRSDGTLWSWGLNNVGQLGTGDLISRSSPVQVAGGGSWSSVSAGISYTVGITSDNTLYTWGINTAGQLGIGNTLNRSNPAQVSGSWSKISAGGSFMTAIDSLGKLFAWGLGTSGQLGNDAAANRSSPVQVGISSWSQISSGTDHTLAISNDNLLFVWGNGGAGQLGFNLIIGANRSSPTQLGTSSWIKISAGTSHSAAIRSDGALFAWGVNGGDGTNITRSSPVQIGTSSWTSVFSHGVGNGPAIHAIRVDGTLWAWGTNLAGELGDNTLISKSSPVQIGTLSNWNSLGSSSAINNDGILYRWGVNNQGQIGAGYNSGVTSQSSPATVGNNSIFINILSPLQIGTSSWTQVSAGASFTLGRDINGTLYGWGQDTTGQLGI